MIWLSLMNENEVALVPPNFTPVPGTARFSTRGERGETWRTKRHGGMRCFPSDVDHAKEKRRSQNQAHGLNLIFALYDRAKHSGPVETRPKGTPSDLRSPS